LGEDAAADFFEAGFGGEAPDAIDRGVEPELEEDVVGFEGDVGEEFAAPVAVRFLDADQGLGAAAAGFAGGAEEGAAFADDLDRVRSSAMGRRVSPVRTHRGA
jgi:hypothetical protein